MEIGIREREARQVVGLRGETRMATIGADIVRMLGEVSAAVGDRMRGPPLIRYLTWDGDGGAIEAAVPVDAADVDGLVASDERLTADELPGGRAVVGVLVGPYDGLAAAWHETQQWMSGQGLSAAAPPWEEYLDDCRATPPERVRTLIVRPIA